MNFIKEISDTYKKLLGDGKFLSEEKLKESYEIFRNNFGPEKLKSLDGEVLLNTIFNHSNRTSLVYWLEFKNDDELQTGRFGGIGGGSALKFVIYKRKEDGMWMTGNPRDMKELELDEAIDIARDKRDLLIKGAAIIEAIPDNFDDDTYLKLQDDINNELDGFGNLGWVHKYFHMLYPEKIDAFHNTDWQNFYIIKMLEKPIKTDGRYALAAQYMRFSKQTDIRINNLTRVLMEYFGPLHNYWKIGINNHTKSSWQEMLDNNYMSVEWSGLGDLKEIDWMSGKEAKENLKKIFSEKYSNTPQGVNKAANQMFAFYRNIQPNDVVIAIEDNKIIKIGKVIDGYGYRDDLIFPQSIKVQWFEGGIEKLPKQGEGSGANVNQFRDFDNLIAIEKMLNNSVELTTDNAKIIEEKIINTGIIGKIEGILDRKKNVILYGPPGTGKTYWAEKACLELASKKSFKKTFKETSESEKTILLGNSDSKGLVRSCCFHPSYCYEDFIEGIKPSLLNDQTVFSLKAGIFKSLCEDAKKSPENNFYLIIDEINRGDISRIFGELISIVEVGKRGKEMILPLSRESFSVMDNVYIVGTMNTADKSIALLDIALRRRFGFIEIMPDYSILSPITIENIPIGLWLSELNKRIVEHVGRDSRNLQIGHSYFMENGVPIKSFIKLSKIIQEDIIPLIEEYCYGDYITISKIIGSSFIDIKKQEINQDLFKAENKTDLISALLETDPEIITSSSVQIEENTEDQDPENGDISGEQQA